MMFSPYLVCKGACIPPKSQEKFTQTIRRNPSLPGSQVAQDTNTSFRSQACKSISPQDVSRLHRISWHIHWLCLTRGREMVRFPVTDREKLESLSASKVSVKRFKHPPMRGRQLQASRYSSSWLGRKPSEGKPRRNDFRRRNGDCVWSMRS